MNRRHFLAGLGLVPWLPALAANASSRLIVVHAWGGWDVTFALDPKDRARVDGPYVDEDPYDPNDASAIQTFHGIPILVDPRRRSNVSTFFHNHGMHCTLVNGLQVGAVGHHDGVRRVLTGSAVPGRPDLTTILGVGTDLPLGSIDIAGTGSFGPHVASGARMGPRGQLRALLDPSVRYPAPVDTTVTRPANLPDDAREAVRAWLDGRLVEERARTGDPTGQLAWRAESLERAKRLVDADIADHLPLGNRQSLTSNVNAALDLLEGNVCRAVLLDSGEHWDTHANQDQQHGAYQGLFGGLGRLAAGLLARGMTDTRILVVTEMSRSPRRNADNGTEHWPTTSALWFDPAQTEGRVIGRTDEHVVALPVDLATGESASQGEIPRYDHLAAAVLSACDVDPEPWLPGVTPYRALFQG